MVSPIPLYTVDHWSKLLVDPAKCKSWVDLRNPKPTGIDQIPLRRINPTADTMSKFWVVFDDKLLSLC